MTVDLNLPFKKAPILRPHSGVNCKRLLGRGDVLERDAVPIARVRKPVRDNLRLRFLDGVAKRDELRMPV